MSEIDNDAYANESLADVRNDINEVDEKLLELFVKRMEMSERVAAAKKRSGLPIYNAEREKEILDRAKQNGGRFGDSARIFFNMLIDISSSYQQMLLYGEDGKLRKRIMTAGNRLSGKKIACQGTVGAYSHIAAEQFFGDDAEVEFYGNFSEVFDAVTGGEKDFGVLPIENSTAGVVDDVYDLLTRHGFYIVGETDVAVNHCLLAPKGTKLEDIREVYAHPQALAQCARYIKRNGFNANEYSNNAVAAKNVAEWNDKSKAAIASGMAGEKFNLDIIQEGIQDVGGNQTRFIVISKNLIIRDGADKISLTFCLRHETGTLYRTLSRFASSGLNIFKIESRPLKGSSFEYRFYIDFNGNVHDEKICSLLCALSTEVTGFKFLGNY